MDKKWTEMVKKMDTKRIKHGQSGKNRYKNGPKIVHKTDITLTKKSPIIFRILYFQIS